ncbi:XRE family transcriptional regulator [Egibacter rhizosphaerae]|uniref:XRE family transcriptional regulator n=1 Tax=Egibacter rhizosphaerae TaxID=1670831 RepID=A0A411YGB5_9ACTN|nr:helix-turn-helix transcriptional regulator [Egibacter rhizosphaerae]QBI20253.1 XRE family transcriptional regulator [Egibacter rhizosphaerae]
MEPSEAPGAAAATVREVGSYIREQRKAAQLSLRKLARMADISDPYLSQIERGLRKPSADILQRVADALEVSAETLYIQAGILDEPSDDLGERILADPHLTEVQKRALHEIYRSFRASGEAEGTGDAASR